MLRLLSAPPKLSSTKARGLQGQAAFHVNISAVTGSSSANATATATATATANAHANRTVYACTIAMDATFGVELSVAYNSSVSAIFANVTDLALNATVVHSGIGPLDPLPLELISKVFRPVVLAWLKPWLANGFPLPSQPYFKLVNSSIHFNDGYFEVASDFTSSF